MCWSVAPGLSCTNFSLLATPAGTSYSDTSVLANTDYNYRVAAVDMNGVTGPYSSVAHAYTGFAISPSRPR